MEPLTVNEDRAGAAIEAQMQPQAGPTCQPDLRPRLGETEAEQFALAFKALSSPVRVQILDLISQGGGDLCACDIERHFDLSQPTIAHHLRVLREAGLITAHPRGVWMAYRLNPAMLTALQGLLMLINNTRR